MLKIACVPYLNAKPLIASLDSKEFELFYQPPAQLEKILMQEKADLALLPILNYFENSRLKLVPGLCIGCRGTVESVKLFSSKPIQEVRHIYLDVESRTSQNLLKVILKEKYGRDLEGICFYGSLEERELIEAYLLIGDKAMIDPPQTSYEYDLGAEWTEWQKLPFVFAAWMSTRNLETTIAQVLQKALNKSFKYIDLLLNDFENGLGRERLRHYFTSSIHYIMGEEELRGITRFFELLKPIQGYTHELHFRFV
ncbi:MAG: menaquinone biosynthesis protein [Deltaproteobacteria bacterium]|nr:menaquinone biosynthesis protein [Deltaproteobacteria bacterium]